MSEDTIVIAACMLLPYWKEAMRNSIEGISTKDKVEKAKKLAIEEATEIYNKVWKNTLDIQKSIMLESFNSIPVSDEIDNDKFDLSK